MRIIHHPILCNYYVTYRCNASCGFCDIWEKPSPYIQMAEAEANMRDLKRLGVKVIDFTGGEPLLHRGLHELLAMAKRMGFITTVTTNGLLYPKRATALKGLVDMLHFSLDSFSQAEHDQMRGVACYEAVMESIRVAKSLGERPDILFTVFPHNLAQIEAVHAQICRPNGLVLLLNPVFAYNQVDTAGNFSTGQLAELTEWGKKDRVYLNQAFIELRRDGGNHVRNPICKAGTSTVVISPDNQLVTPCYHLGKNQHPIQGDLYALYRSEKIQAELREEGRLPGCEGCTINCYMQPSFAVEMNKYWWLALPSTLRYNWWKGTWRQLI